MQSFTSVLRIVDCPKKGAGESDRSASSLRATDGFTDARDAPHISHSTR